MTIMAEPSHEQIYLAIILIDKLGSRSTVTGLQSSNQRLPHLIRMHVALARMHPIRYKIRRIGLLFRQFCPFSEYFRLNLTPEQCSVNLTWLQYQISTRAKRS